MRADESIKEVLESQDWLRQRMIRLMRISPISIGKLSKELDLSAITLRRFLLEEKKISIETILWLESYVNKREDEFKDQIEEYEKRRKNYETLDEIGE